MIFASTTPCQGAGHVIVVSACPTVCPFSRPHPGTASRDRTPLPTLAARRPLRTRTTHRYLLVASRRHYRGVQTSLPRRRRCRTQPRIQRHLCARRRREPAV